MSRYTDAKCRLCRREMTKLYLKGAKCYTDKCPLEKRKFPPGKSAKGRQTQLIGYNLQLREKQKVKRHYGMNEKQFYLTFLKANRMSGVTGENLIQLLERRLDNVIYKAGFAESRNQARQLVRHGFFKLNGKNVDIPSLMVKKGDVIEIKENKKKKVEDLVDRAKALANSPNRGLPNWFNVDYEAYKIEVVDMPTRKDISIPVEEHLIVELYSK